MNQDFIKKPWLGAICAISVMLVWATWFVVSRHGVISELYPTDLMALRFGISGIIVLPVVIYFKPWQSMSLLRMFILSMLLGPFYMMFIFGGFIFAPASHGGIFMNGSLPFLTLFIGWIWLSEKIRFLHLIGVALILFGGSLAVIDANQLQLYDSWKGDLMLLIAGGCFAGYLVISRVWKISLTQVLLCSSLINAIWYVPLWYLFLPTNLDKIPLDNLLIQSFYQGLVPTLFGLLALVIAVRHIGSASTSAFLSGVPGVSTILSIIFLNEVPGIFGWIGLLFLSPGILMIALTKNKEK